MSKDEINQLKIKNEELNKKLEREIELDKAIDDAKKIGEHDRYKLPEPKPFQKYYIVYSGKEKGIDYRHHTMLEDKNNYKRFNCFLSEDIAIKRSKQVENYFKLLHYLDVINDGWKPDYNDCNYVIYSQGNNILEDWYKFPSPLIFKSREARRIFRMYVTDDEIRTFLNPIQGV
jgi:hypothetical protein